MENISAMTLNEKRAGREGRTGLQKETIRKQMIRRLGEQSLGERERKSSAIQEKVLAGREFKDAATVLIYVALPTEVDTKYLIQKALDMGKRVGVPYIEPGEGNMTASEININYRLEKGPLGIKQPAPEEVKAIPLEEIDLVIVPAIAYDKNNRRLGRGKGFYDTFLAEKRKTPPQTIGVAFDFQVVEDLPHAPHDRPVDRVITDQERDG